MEISAGKYLRLGASLAGAQSQQHAKKREQLHSYSIGVTIRAENIGTAFEIAEDYLQTLHPASEVIVQAVQHINDEFTLVATHPVTPSKLDWRTIYFYRKAFPAATKENAEKFWAIIPPKAADNIVPMAQAS